ncbi:MAG: hypothetical protein LH468_03765 [Nocardioides sp.]|nr:hypothetical protein [Nocardioides sp.]
MGEAQGQCAARETIAQIGLARLVEIGFFTPAMEFADLELAPHPDVKAALATATLTCLAS